MPPAFKRRVQPQRQNLVGEAKGDDAASHREDIGIVMLARQPGRVEIVAERRANAPHCVRRDLFALSAAAKDDATVRAAFSDRLSYADADGRVVDRRLAAGPVIVHDVAKTGQRLLEMFFE